MYNVEKLIEKTVQEASEDLEVIIDSLYMETAEDDWNRGEIGRPQLVLSKENLGSFRDVESVVKEASKISGIPERNFFIFDGENGRIEGTGLVDEDNFYVGDDQTFLDKFKRGEVRAWNADVSVYIKFAKTYKPSPKEIKQSSNLSFI